MNVQVWGQVYGPLNPSLTTVKLSNLSIYQMAEYMSILLLHFVEFYKGRKPRVLGRKGVEGGYPPFLLLSVCKI
jgi:hypothetical protein